MAANDQSDNNELKKRFDNFLREARFQDKPYRLLGRPQIANKQVSVLVAYPALENGENKASFAAALNDQLKAYGLEPGSPAPHKSGLRIQARLLAMHSPESGEK